jgi:hypothetical protein
MLTTKRRIIIFYRNAVYGTVKTRLAATVGKDAALRIYQKLVNHTHQVTLPLEVEKVVYCSDRIEDDVWREPFYKQLQRGQDLGARMSLAFQEAFDAGCHRVVIIGTDCFELTTPVLEEAFRQLESHEAVIGPAMDGGYYLLGLTRPVPGIFENKTWSTPTVLEETRWDLEREQIRYMELPLLRDVDEEKDLPSGLL